MERVVLKGFSVAASVRALLVFFMTGVLAFSCSFSSMRSTFNLNVSETSVPDEQVSVDWFNQRIDACKDRELRAILALNRDEKKGHAAMILERIRRKDEPFNGELKDYIVTGRPIAR